jgi:hypothetical protein
VLRKFRRASEHLRLLREQTERFIELPAYVPVVDEDPRSGEHVLRVAVRAWPPVLDWAVLAGDAIHNLRSGLDHLAYALCGDPPPRPEKAAFPIFDTETAFEAKAPERLRGAPSEVIRLIKQMQPGAGSRTSPGNHCDPLWVLQELSNSEKHRLVLSVTGTTHGANFPNLGPELERSTREMVTVGVGVLRQVITQQDQELVRWSPDPDKPKLQPGRDMEVAFLVAFDPDGPGRGRALYETLRNIDEHIRQRVLWPLCPHLPGMALSDVELALAISRLSTR